MKPHEAIVLPLPWTGGIRTSQGPGSNHGSWVLSTSFLTAVAKQTPGRNNLRNERLLLAWSLGGVSWQGGMRQIIEAGNTEGGHRKRPGQDSGFKDTLPVTYCLQKTSSHPLLLPSEAIRLPVHQGTDPFFRSEHWQSTFLGTHPHRHTQGRPH